MAKQTTAKLNVRVQPRSSQNKIVIQPDGSVKVWITVAPVDGKANEAVIELLSKQLTIPKTSIKITRGVTSKQKEFELTELTHEEMLRRINQL